MIHSIRYFEVQLFEIDCEGYDGWTIINVFDIESEAVALCDEYRADGHKARIVPRN